MSKLPPMTGQPILHVDATPNDGYVLRILRAYLHNARCKWAQEGGKPSPVLETMNAHCDQRAALLEKAIKALEEADAR